MTSTHNTAAPPRETPEHHGHTPPSVFTLTIDAETGHTISEHPDRDSAHKALTKYLTHADYYLNPIQTTTTHSSYELLALSDLADHNHLLDRRPRTAGHATIEQLPTTDAS